MPKLVIHKDTRVVFYSTGEEDPKLLPYQLAVDVPEKFDLAPFAGGKKLGLDGVTAEDPSDQEKSNTLDDMIPARTKKRALLDAIEGAQKDLATTPALKTLILALQDFIGTNLPGQF